MCNPRLSSKFQLLCMLPCATLLGIKHFIYATGGTQAMGAMNAGSFTLPLILAGWACIGLACMMMWKRERVSPKSQTSRSPSSHH
jgi:hypothetical protein